MLSVKSGAEMEAGRIELPPVLSIAGPGCYYAGVLQVPG